RPTCKGGLFRSLNSRLISEEITSSAFHNHFLPRSRNSSFAAFSERYSARSLFSGLFIRIGEWGVRNAECGMRNEELSWIQQSEIFIPHSAFRIPHSAFVRFHAGWPALCASSLRRRIRDRCRRASPSRCA